MGLPAHLLEVGKAYHYVHPSKGIDEKVTVHSIEYSDAIDKRGQPYRRRSVQIKRADGEVHYVGAARLRSADRPDLSHVDMSAVPVEVQQAGASANPHWWDEIGQSVSVSVNTADFASYVGDHVQLTFANLSELIFASKIDKAGLAWDHEPTAFSFDQPVGSSRPRGFLPDFYLPDHELYIELTTGISGDKSGKNVKQRLMKQQHPSVQVLILTRDAFAACMSADQPLEIMRKVYTHQQQRFAEPSLSKSPQL